MNWDDKPTVRKGHIGEMLVLQWLESKGVIVYLPNTRAAHPFDKLCATPDKKTIFVAEVKTKPHRLYYPDTGINLGHYEDYSLIRNKYNLRVHIFFVDDNKGMVYGNWLDQLEVPREVIHNEKTYQYPLKQKDIIYFPLVAMNDICELPSEEVAKIKMAHQGKYAYPLEQTA